MIEYTDYRFLYPPRPERSVAPGLWSHFGRCVQIKKNGHHVVVAVRGDEVIVRTRHNTIPCRMPRLRFTTLGGSGWYVFCGELLADRVFIFDLLVFNGWYLLGKGHIERQKMLDGCFKYGRGRISGELEVAINYDDPQEAARMLVHGEDEGLVFRMPGIGLLPCVRERANVAGLFKWRRK